MVDIRELAKTDREAALFLHRETAVQDWEARRNRSSSGWWLYPRETVVRQISRRILREGIGTPGLRPTAVY